MLYVSMLFLVKFGNRLGHNIFIIAFNQSILFRISFSCEEIEIFI